jgi:rRNA maturation RNase YbeY
LAIRFFSDGVSFQPKNKRKISQGLKSVADREGKQIGNLSYVFVSDEKILEINNWFLQHDYYTDIITFDDSSENTISGEMYISIDTVRTNAEEYQTDFAEELLRVMIHGVLHLCGYDDKTEKDRQQMRAAETKYLNFWND